MEEKDILKCPKCGGVCFPVETSYPSDFKTDNSYKPIKITDFCCEKCGEIIDELDIPTEVQ